jgi:hypothetical protein
MKNYEYEPSLFERHVNLFNLGLSALTNPEHGENQVSDEQKIDALKMQIEHYEKAISELKQT